MNINCVIQWLVTDLSNVCYQPFAQLGQLNNYPLDEYYKTLSKVIQWRFIQPTNSANQQLNR